MEQAKGRASQRLRESDVCESLGHWGSLPVPSFGIPLAAPWSRSELLECSLVLSIFALLLWSVRNSSRLMDKGASRANKRGDELIDVRKTQMQLLCTPALFKNNDFICAKKVDMFLLIFSLVISEILCGVPFSILPAVTIRSLPSRPLSKTRQMTSTPAAAAHHQNTRGRLGKTSSTLSTPSTHVISDCTALKLTRIDIGRIEGQYP
jgi:hypothetical protein